MAAVQQTTRRKWWRAREPLGIAFAAWWLMGFAVGGCFNGADAQGLRCEDDDQCGKDQSCEQGYCGGPPVGEDLCGNGFVDTGEECDEGESNDDSGSCTSSCQNADCGDGLIQSGEECDEGAEGSAACDPDCTAAQCGDGLVNALAGEECEPALAGQSSASCMSNCFEPLLWEDAESDAGWSHATVDPPLVSDWFRSEDFSAGGSFSWHSGAPGDLPGSARLTSPGFDLDGSEGAVTLSIAHRHAFDAVGICDDEGHQSDGAVVEYSVGGGPFQLLDPVQPNGYPGTVSDDGDCEGLGEDPNPLVGSGAFTRSNPGFETARFDLTGVTGQVRVGFRVGFDCGECPGDPVEEAGWYVDDIVVYRGSPEL
jgi:hypothetical protein